MSRGVKATGIILGIIVLIALLLFAAWLWFSRQAIPVTEGTIDVAGLSAPVEILRDEYGIPHIYADTTEDLFFAQGYTHAQERFWQMEFQRRTGAGRLSEIFGETTLETDRYLRHFGFYDSTVAAYNDLEPATKKALDSYTVGVNAYIQDRSPGQLGLEFALLGVQGTEIEIEPWTPIDSMIWAYMMIFDQGGRPNRDVSTANMIASLGVDAFTDMQPPYRDDRPVIIATEELEFLSDIDTTPLAALNDAELAYLARFSASVTGDGLPPLLAEITSPYGSGSNSFALSGDLTATGLPILANDPHMGVRMPSLWYEMGLHCRVKSDACPYNFRGFSLPGVAGVLIGHNDHIAWGLTNAAFDAEDVFIERINPDNPNQYEVNGEWVDMELRREEIFVQGRDEPVVFTVRSTRNGVIASDSMVNASRFGATDEGTEPYALSFAWTALEPVQTFQAVEKIVRSENWEEFTEALRFFEAGKQNLLYADIEGNIGYYMPGKVPIRAGGDGTVPVPGWNDDFIWTGFIPFEQAPHVFNPEDGFIVTANNPQVRAEDYPFHIATFQDRGQRAQRIVNMIQSAPGLLTVEDVQAIQTDNQSLSALEVIPYLQGLTIADPAVASARDRLTGWGGQMHKDSPEAALFNFFWVELIDATYNDQILPDYFPDGAHATSDSMYFLLQEPDDPWWDDKRTADLVEDRDTILARSLTNAHAAAVAELGETFDDWRWGDLHQIMFINDTLGQSGIGLIENLFNRGPFAVSGSESVPQKTCWNANAGFEVTCIPAARQIVDLSDLDNSLAIHSVGQSGHPMSPHYDDLIEIWRNLDYHPTRWDRETVESGEYTLLTLRPLGN